MRVGARSLQARTHSSIRDADQTVVADIRLISDTLAALAISSRAVSRVHGFVVIGERTGRDARHKGGRMSQ